MKLSLALLSGDVADSVGGARLIRSGTRKGQGLRDKPRVKCFGGKSIWQTDDKPRGLAADSRWLAGGWHLGGLTWIQQQVFQQQARLR